MLTIIDVSNNQRVIDWRRVAESGVRLAFVKATEGRHYTDPYFSRNRAEAASHGIRVGAYLFARPESGDWQAQAQRFAAVVGRLARHELRPVVDLETGNPARVEAFAHLLSQEIRRRLGVTPLLYSYSAYLEAMRLSKPIGGGLWLASYGRNDGRDHGAVAPRPWRRWVAHQFTSNARFPGVPGAVDVSHAPQLRPLLAHPLADLL